MTTVLIWTGAGSFWHIPARDLTDEDLAEIAQLPEEYRMDEAALVRSGLYKKAGYVFTDQAIEEAIEAIKPTTKKGRTKKEGE